MMNEEHISQEDLALYAMQCLNDTEAAAVQAHLAECSACREEMATVLGDVALIGLGVEQHAVPDGARGRFLDRMAADAGSNAVAAAGTSPVASLPVTTREVVQVIRKPRVSLWTNPFAWATAALIVAAIGLGMRVGTLQSELADAKGRIASMAESSAKAQRVLDLLTLRSAQHVLLTVGAKQPEPSATAVYLADRGSLIFQAHNLKAVAENKTYELWVIPANGTAPIPAGLFKPDAAGNASVTLPDLPKGVEAKAFGVTIEQADGSAKPTLPIVLAGAATPSS